MLQKRKFINYLLYLRKFWVLIYFYQLYLKFMEIFEFQFLILIFQGVSISILRNIQILLEIKITQKTLPYIIPHRFSIYVYKIGNPRQKFPIQQTNQHFHLQRKLHFKTSLNRKLNFYIYLWKIRFSRIFFIIFIQLCMYEGTCVGESTRTVYFDGKFYEKFFSKLTYLLKILEESFLF